jgi:drug/metabolite transporter (DMT)-like permease
LTQTDERQAGESSFTTEKSHNTGESSLAVGRFTLTDLMLLFCIIIWALNAPFIKIVLDEMEPLAVSQLRITVAGLICFGLLLIREKSIRIAWRHLPLLGLAAFMGVTANQISFVYALKNTTASEVSLLYAASPLFATLLAALTFQEKLKRSYFIGLPLSLFGVALIILTAPNAALDGSILGNFFAIGMAFTWAVYTVALRPLLRYYSPLRLSAYCFTIGSLLLFPFSLSQVAAIGEKPPSAGAWLILLFSATVAMVFTNILWYNGVKKLGVSRTTYYAYLQPFFGVIAAALLLGEAIVPWQILGGLLVIGSLLIYRLIK